MRKPNSRKIWSLLWMLFIRFLIEQTANCFKQVVSTGWTIEQKFNKCFIAIKMPHLVIRFRLSRVVNIHFPSSSFSWLFQQWSLRCLSSFFSRIHRFHDHGIESLFSFRFSAFIRIINLGLCFLHRIHWKLLTVSQRQSSTVNTYSAMKPCNRRDEQCVRYKLESMSWLVSSVAYTSNSNLIINLRRSMSAVFMRNYASISAVYYFRFYAVAEDSRIFSCRWLSGAFCLVLVSHQQLKYTNIERKCFLSNAHKKKKVAQYLVPVWTTCI